MNAEDVAASRAGAKAGHEARVARVAAKLASEGIGAALFEDAEGRRDQAIRYLSGQPGDALFVISAEGESVLIAWDVNLARLLADAGEILAYTDYARLPIRALSEALARLKVAPGSKVELPSTFAYPRYIEFVEGLSGYDLVCRNDGIDAFVGSLRAVKDESEIALYRRLSKITDHIMDEIEAKVRSGVISTEMDAALFIERAGRAAGCEGVGFETLAAGPTRSWGIHAFPPYGAGPFAAEGMSILDFGLRLEGYTSDVTMSFLKGEMGQERERMVELVERAHDETIAMLEPGRLCREVSFRADAIFAEASLVMPHGLGHGVGLDAHESPSMKNREDWPDILRPGNIVTIEPGLYHPELGGVRWEDDILITDAGHEVLTRSRIVRL